MSTRAGVLVLSALVAAATGACGGGAGGSPAVNSATPVQASAAPDSVPLESSLPDTALPAPRPTDVPSRVVVRDLDIDVPVISGDTTLPGNPPDYPLCDVAQYLTTYPYPGRLGTTTWIYSHARQGMFLPLLEASRRADGAELIGGTVDVFSSGNVRYRYRITDVLRHTTDRSAARDVPADQGRLILQTSEGPRGTVPKLQIVAELVESRVVSAAEAQPAASPRVCSVT